MGCGQEGGHTHQVEASTSECHLGGRERGRERGREGERRGVSSSSEGHLVMLILVKGVGGGECVISASEGWGRRWVCYLS